MVVRELKVKDFFGNEREYKLYFDLEEAEIMELEYGKIKGGVTELYARMLREQDMPTIMATMKEIVLAAYGIVSLDGESFQKSDEISRQFTFTKAYNELMMRLYTDDAYGKAFITELIPRETIQKILDRVEENKKKNEATTEEGNVAQFPTQEASVGQVPTV